LSITTRGFSAPRCVPYEVRQGRGYFCDLPDLTIAPDTCSRWPSIFSTARPASLTRDLPGPYEEALAGASEGQAGPAPFQSAGRPLPRRTGWSISWRQLRRSVAEDTKGAAPRKGALGNPGAQTGRECHSPPAAMLPLADSRTAPCVCCWIPCAWWPSTPPTAGCATSPRTSTASCDSWAGRRVRARPAHANGDAVARRHLRRQTQAARRLKGTARPHAVRR